MSRFLMLLMFCTVLVVATEPVEAGFLGGVSRTIDRTSRDVGRFVRRNRTEIFTVGGIIIGASVADNALLGAAIGGLVGYTIAKSLTPVDNRRMARSTQTTLVSGEADEWENEKTGVRGRTTLQDEAVEEKTFKTRYVKERVNELPPLEYNVGGQYKVVQETILRSGPGADYQGYEVLNKDQNIDVMAKVEGKPWYLASHNGVGLGFVDATALQATGMPVYTSKKRNRSKPGAEIVESEISVRQTCRTVEQQVTKRDGKTVTEVHRACQQPDGSWS